MRVIKDKDGQDWKVPSFGTGTITDLREQANFIIGDWKGKTSDEANEAGAGLLLSLYDPFVLGAVLWVLLQTQAEQRGLDATKFGHCFTSDEYPAAREAIVGSILDFRYPPQVAETLKKVLAGEMAMIESVTPADSKNSATGSAASAA